MEDWERFGFASEQEAIDAGFYDRNTLSEIETNPEQGTFNTLQEETESIKARVAQNKAKAVGKETPIEQEEEMDDTAGSYDVWDSDGNLVGSFNLETYWLK